MPRVTFASVLALHPNPHFDDLVRAVMIFLFGERSFDLDGSRTGTPVKIKMVSAGTLTEDQRVALEARGWIFVGVAGGEHDEHGMDPGLAAATMAFEGLDANQFRARFNERMRGYGVPGNQLESCWGRFQSLLAYTGHKDNHANAMRLGLSWTFKQVVRMMCYDLEDGSVKQRDLCQEDIRYLMRWTLEIVVGATGVPHDSTTGVDQTVDELVCRWICRQRKVSFHPSMTLPGIIETIRRGRQPVKWLLRRLRSLQSAIYSVNNSAEYGDVERWLVGWFMATNPQFTMPDGVTSSSITDVIDELQAMPSDTPHRGSLLSGLGNLEGRRAGEESIRAQNGNDPALDERTPQCPFSFHAVVRMLLMRDHGDVSCDAFATKRLAPRFVNMVLDTWWKYSELEALGNAEAGNATRIPVFRDGEKFGDVCYVSTINPATAPKCFSSGAVVVVNVHPDNGHVYIATNQRLVGGMENSDALLRDIAWLVRILEIRVQGHDLPDDLDSLRASGMLADARWYLATNGDGYAHTVMNGSIHHPDVPTTEVPPMAYMAVVAHVASAHVAQQRLCADIVRAVASLPIDDLPELLIARRA